MFNGIVSGTSTSHLAHAPLCMINYVHVPFTYVILHHYRSTYLGRYIIKHAAGQLVHITKLRHFAGNRFFKSLTSNSENIFLSFGVRDVSWGVSNAQFRIVRHFSRVATSDSFSLIVWNITKLTLKSELYSISIKFKQLENIFTMFRSWSL